MLNSPRLWKWKLAFDVLVWGWDIGSDSFGWAWMMIAMVIVDLFILRDCLQRRGAQ